QREFKKMQTINFISVFFVALQAIIPMLILVILGPTAVNAVIDSVPEWITNGLSIAGGMLPVVGVAMLMRYMPTQRYMWAVLIGFVMAAYLEQGVLAVSIIGLALAFITYSRFSDQKNVAAASPNGDQDFDEGV